MNKILIVNAGSSSLKYQLIDIDDRSVIAKGLCERIGIDNPKITYKPANGEGFSNNAEMKNHEDAISLVLNALSDPEIGVIKDMKEIKAVGHRVLHGGVKFSDPALIDDKVLEAIEECIPLGPLHNPANLMGIRGCMAVMPDTPMVAVFDTAWGMKMAEKSYMYALPYEAYEQYQIRRYGFHGTSHMYVTGRALDIIDIPKDNAKIITCHLGNGSSVSCSIGGKCVDTSMGLTPLEGLPMGTRCGSIDPAIVPFLMKKTGMSPDEMDKYMNKQSGMLGISGISSDFRDLGEAQNNGNPRAKLALDMFIYAVKKYIGSYAAAMNGVDAIVFTAGVGENDRYVREQILKDMEYLGLDVDFEYNKNCPRGEEVLITKPDSKVKVYVIPTDEEMAIALETARLAGVK